MGTVREAWGRQTQAGDGTDVGQEWGEEFEAKACWKVGSRYSAWCVRRNRHCTMELGGEGWGLESESCLCPCEARGKLCLLRGQV